jgi:methylated-DNA-[protein]-cysteine S-methyltransferase
MRVVSHVDTPIGMLTPRFDEQGNLCELRFGEGIGFGLQASGAFGEEPQTPEARRLVCQLGEYFAGKRETFDVPMSMKGTPFQLAVWNELTRIPYGHTISYAELAFRIGKPSAVRAVGAANGANPIPVIVPCHRVIGANGSLTGYGGGIERKQWLLALEGRRLF